MKNVTTKTGSLFCKHVSIEAVASKQSPIRWGIYRKLFCNMETLLRTFYLKRWCVEYGSFNEMIHCFHTSRYICWQTYFGDTFFSIQFEFSTYFIFSRIHVFFNLCINVFVFSVPINFLSFDGFSLYLNISQFLILTLNT